MHLTIRLSLVVTVQLEENGPEWQNILKTMAGPLRPLQQFRTTASLHKLASNAKPPERTTAFSPRHRPRLDRCPLQPRFEQDYDNRP